MASHTYPSLVHQKSGPNSAADATNTPGRENANEVLESAHGLKGMSANMGFTELARAAHHMETLGRHYNLQDGSSVFDSVQKEFARVHEALQDVLEQEELSSK